VYYQDEAGFHLLVSRQATWAPIAQTPPLLAPTHCPHLSVSVAISETGDLFYEVRESAFNSQAIVRFLTNLLQGKRKQLFLLWDSARIHTSKVVQAFLMQLKEGRIHLAHTPKYAPATNAAEQVWNYVKNVQLANCVFKTIQDLKKAVTQALEDLKNRPQLIRQFFHHPKVAFHN
jgi:hypothetical protein